MLETILTCMLYLKNMSEMEFFTKIDGKERQYLISRRI